VKTWANVISHRVQYVDLHVSYALEIAYSFDTIQQTHVQK